MDKIVESSSESSDEYNRRDRYNDGYSVIWTIIKTNASENVDMISVNAIDWYENISTRIAGCVIKPNS